MFLQILCACFKIKGYFLVRAARYITTIPFLSQAPTRKRFKHNETTIEIKSVVDSFNEQFDGWYKIMVYWPRLAIGFLIMKENKLKQASLPNQNMIKSLLA